ncbi:MAG: hypothetical protein MI717_08395 [Spirochaetales bacterium]|nr:hypothetical protein [Spirochaetales bacterium]
MSQIKSLLRSYFAQISLILICVAMSACSGVIGNVGQITVTLPLQRGRYISTHASSGYIVAMKDGQNVASASYQGGTFAELRNGEAVLEDLAPGRYIIGVVLTGIVLDEEYNVGFALKAVNVESGRNQVEIPVGPGLNFLEINGTMVNDLFRNPSLPIRFEENRIIFTDIGEPGLQGHYFDVIFSDREEANVTALSPRYVHSGGIGDPAIRQAPGESGVEAYSIPSDPNNQEELQGVEFLFRYGRGLTGPDSLILEFQYTP